MVRGMTRSSSIQPLYILSYKRSWAAPSLDKAGPNEAEPTFTPSFPIPFANLFTPSLPHFRPWMPRGWGGCLLHTTSRTEEHKAFIYVQVLLFRMKVILVLSIINNNNNNRRLVTLAEHHRASAITFSLLLSRDMLDYEVKLSQPFHPSSLAPRV